jgi:putative flippase GtrA
MTATQENTAPRPFYERLLRFIIVGGFTLIVLYLKAMAAIINFGIRAIQKIPMDGEKK